MRLIFWAIVWSVMFSSMRMTFLCALISCVETIAGLRRLHRDRTCGVRRHRPALRPIIGPARLLAAGADVAPRARAAGGACARVVLDAARHAPAGRRRCAVRGALTGVGIGHAGTTGPVLDAGLGGRARAASAGDRRRLLHGRRRSATAGGGGGRRRRRREHGRGRGGGRLTAAARGGRCLRRPRRCRSGGGRSVDGGSLDRTRSRRRGARRRARRARRVARALRVADTLRAGAARASRALATHPRGTRDDRRAARSRVARLRAARVPVRARRATAGASVVQETATEGADVGEGRRLRTAGAAEAATTGLRDRRGA